MANYAFISAFLSSCSLEELEELKDIICQEIDKRAASLKVEIEETNLEQNSDETEGTNLTQTSDGNEETNLEQISNESLLNIPIDCICLPRFGCPSHSIVSVTAATRCHNNHLGTRRRIEHAFGDQLLLAAIGQAHGGSMAAGIS